MEVGELLSDMFLGSYGDRLISVGAEFTKNQEFTLAELKKIRQRDSRIEAKIAHDFDRGRSTTTARPCTPTSRW